MPPGIRVDPEYCPHTVKNNLDYEEHNSSRVVPGLVWSEREILDPWFGMWDLTVWPSWRNWLNLVWFSAHGLKELVHYWSQVQPPSGTSIVACVVGDRGTRPPGSHIARPPGLLFPSRHGRKRVACVAVCE